MGRFNAISAVFWFSLLATPTLSQSLKQLPNADFSRWKEAEPVGWFTNNVYDEQGKLVQTLVQPAGTVGAKLGVKRVVFRAAAPALTGFRAGELSSPPIPYLADAGKPIQLQFSYQFAPDSADVLRADISLDTRDTEPGTLVAANACACKLTSSLGRFPLVLPPAATPQTITVGAIFGGGTTPNAVPANCLLFAWKIRFWLDKPVAGPTHPHEASVAVIGELRY